MGGSCHPKPRLNKHDRVVAGPVVRSVNRRSAYSSVPSPSETMVVRRVTIRLGEYNQHRPVSMQSRGLQYIGSPDPGGSTPWGTALSSAQQMREPVSTQSRGSGCVGTPDPGGSTSLEVEMPGQPRMSSALQRPLGLSRTRLDAKHQMAPCRTKRLAGCSGDGLFRIPASQLDTSLGYSAPPRTLDTSQDQEPRTSKQECSVMDSCVSVLWNSRTGMDSC